MQTQIQNGSQIHQTVLCQLTNQTVCRTLQMRSRCSALVCLPRTHPVDDSLLLLLVLLLIIIINSIPPTVKNINNTVIIIIIIIRRTTINLRLRPLPFIRPLITANKMNTNTKQSAKKYQWQ